MRVTIRINGDEADLIASSKWLWHANFLSIATATVTAATPEQQQQHQSDTNNNSNSNIQWPGTVLPAVASCQFRVLLAVGKRNLHFKSA